MSDQQETGSAVILGLEELFLSGEFGHRPARLASTAPATVAPEPVRLEQVFLADVFGHPELVEESAPAAPARPVLVLLQGGGQGNLERTTARYRAVAAVSGIAAAAVAVAGLPSGTGQAPGGPAPGIEQAQGPPPSRQLPQSGGGSQPGPVQPTIPQVSANTGTSGASVGGGASATLTAFLPPAASVVPSQGEAGGVVAPPAAPPPPGPPGPPAGGSSPGTPPPGGGAGGGMLTPALTVVGNEVSSVGSNVSSTAGDLDQNLPVGPVLQGVGTVATSAVNNLGGGTPPTVLAGSSQP